MEVLQGNLVFLGVLEIVPIILFVVCFRFWWRVRTQDHCECSIAVIEGNIKRLYGHRYIGRMATYRAIATFTFQGKHLRKKLYFTAMVKGVNDLIGYEVPICISLSKRGKVRVWQKERKAVLVFVALLYGILGLIMELPIILALFTILSSS